eukprot:scaffold1466_cov249-Pinguiococcus_pyrenoidosus.AAC.17
MASLANLQLTQGGGGKSSRLRQRIALRCRRDLNQTSRATLRIRERCAGASLSQTHLRRWGFFQQTASTLKDTKLNVRRPILEVPEARDQLTDWRGCSSGSSFAPCWASVWQARGPGTSSSSRIPVSEVRTLGAIA